MISRTKSDALLFHVRYNEEQLPFTFADDYTYTRRRVLSRRTTAESSPGRKIRGQCGARLLPQTSAQELLSVFGLLRALCTRERTVNSRTHLESRDTVTPRRREYRLTGTRDVS